MNESPVALRRISEHLVEGLGPFLTTVVVGVCIVAIVAFVVGLFMGGGLRKRAWAMISGEFAVDLSTESSSPAYSSSRVGELVFDEQRFPGRLSIDDFGIVFQRFLGSKEVRLIFPWSRIDSLKAFNGAKRAEFRVRIGTEQRFIEIPWSADFEAQSKSGATN